LTQEEIQSQHLEKPDTDEEVHVYRLAERAMMQLRLNRIEPADNLMVMPRRILEAMTRPVKPGLLVTGAISSKKEAWDETQEGSWKVAETCATVYELWLLDEMLRVDRDLRYGDIIERVIYNALFGAQDPKGRGMCYYTPFSGKRPYYQRDAWCCPNNFRRGMASLPQFVYYQSDDGVAVNLYAASTAELQLRNGVSLRIEQETEYPSAEQIKIKLSPSAPVSFVMRLRLPRWCAKPAVTVNGASVNGAQPGASFFEINRRWRAGDTIRLRLPMTPRWVKGTQLQEGHAALLRGPVLYGVDPARNPQVAGLDLRTITMDPTSLRGPVTDEATRPSGTAFRVRAWSPGRSRSQKTDLSLTLTEFAGHGTEEVYFLLPDSVRGEVSDELLQGEPGKAAIVP